MNNILEFFRKRKLSSLIFDNIGEPPWGGFCVECSRPIAFKGRELEVTGNPPERLKNANSNNLWRIA